MFTQYIRINYFSCIIKYHTQISCTLLVVHVDHTNYIKCIFYITYKLHLHSWYVFRLTLLDTYNSINIIGLHIIQ